MQIILFLGGYAFPLGLRFFFRLMVFLSVNDFPWSLYYLYIIGVLVYGYTNKERCAEQNRLGRSGGRKIHLLRPLPLSSAGGSWQWAYGGTALMELDRTTESGASNCSGPSLRVRVRFQTALSFNWRSRLSINLNRQLGYDSMVYSQHVWIGRFVRGSPSRSIHRFI